MNKPCSFVFRIAMIGGLAASCASTLSAQTETPSTAAPAKEIVNLPQFSVSEAPVDPYNSAEASSALRTATAILDTPVTVYVITPQLINDINPETLWDVASFFAGVSSGRATGVGGYNDRMTFRGIESFGVTRDNFSDLMVPAMTAPFDNFDPVFMDHAELIMGPDSILSPTGTAGGTLVAQTKSPLFHRETEITAMEGNYNGNRYSIDTTGPIGSSGHMAYRVLAAYEDTPTYQIGTLLGWAVSGQFTYKFSDATKFTFKYFGQQQYKGGTGGMSDVDGEEVSTPNTLGGVTLQKAPEPGFTYNGWNGIANWDYRLIRDNVLQGEFTTGIGDHISLRLGYQEFYNTEHDNRAYPTPTLTETWNAQTGQEISITQVNPLSIPELDLISRNYSTQEQLQGDLAGIYNVAGVTLSPSFGFDYQQGAMGNQSYKDTNLPPVNLYANYYSPPIPNISAYVFNANTPYEGWTNTVYAYLRASFFRDKLFLSAGASRTWADVNIYSVPYETRSDGVPLGNPNGAVTDKTFSHTLNSLAPTVEPWHDSYVGGVLYKVLPNISAYYNYSTNAALAQAAPLWQKGVQDEFGVKTTWFNNRLSITADHFQIRESNLSYQNPNYTLGISTIPFIYTDLTNHGEELNIMGGITSNLSVVASYTNMQLRDFVGRRQRNIPDNMANLLLDYHFKLLNPVDTTQNSDVFLGINHVGSVAGETVAGFTSLGVPELPGYYLPEYTVFSGGAGYRIGRYKFNLNIINLFNQKFWWEAQSRESLEPYPGFTVTIKVTIHI